MKTTDAAESSNGSKRMKSESLGPGKSGQRRTPMMMTQLPMEWMDPMSWRLPSGKALAEFALQAGFLAPLMMGTPRLKKRKAAAPSVVVPIVGADKRVKEAPEHSGTFRERRF
jgi:hypothetical protein